MAKTQNEAIDELTRINGAMKVKIEVMEGNINVGNTISETRLLDETNGDKSISITGVEKINQGDSSVAIGQLAGSDTQGVAAVAIGNFAANSYQGDSAIAIGASSGGSSQGENSIAVGTNAGSSHQEGRSIAIGNETGQSKQGAGAVAIGSTAGRDTQGQDAVAIGNEAGTTAQPNESIAIGNKSKPTEEGGIYIGSADVPTNVIEVKGGKITIGGESVGYDWEDITATYDSLKLSKDDAISQFYVEWTEKISNFEKAGICKSFWIKETAGPIEYIRILDHDGNWVFQWDIDGIGSVPDDSPTITKMMVKWK